MLRRRSTTFFASCMGQLGSGLWIRIRWSYLKTWLRKCPLYKEEEKESKVAYSRKKPRRRFGGRNQDLPTKTIVMDPEGELSHLKKIGEEVHRVFHDQPARIFVYEYVRNKYVDPTNQGAGVLMGELPANVSGKRTASAEMLAQIVIHKYVDHLPVDRTRKPFSRLGADLPSSTLNDVCTHVAKDLKPLYELHRQEVLDSRIYTGGMRPAFRCGIPSRATRRASIILVIIGCTLHRLRCSCLWSTSVDDRAMVR